jgi:methylated-DNA-[protein]-cysteine S-methyltransferase
MEKRKKGSRMDFFVDQIASPIGTLLLVANGEQLCALDYADCESRMQRLLRARYGDIRLQEKPDGCRFSRALRAYVAGDLTSIDDLPVCTGGTPFQQQVWATLRTIRPGAVMTYRELAERVGRPSAYRAVGMTNALNPIAIVIPCHRLVGADGTLTGYAGGLACKRWLLEHEGVRCDGDAIKTL